MSRLFYDFILQTSRLFCDGGCTTFVAFYKSFFLLFIFTYIKKLRKGEAVCRKKEKKRGSYLLQIIYPKKKCIKIDI
jgi:hypothetical protein